MVGGGLHDGGEAVLLEALDEGVFMIACVTGGIGAGAALPDPEVGPHEGELVCGEAAAVGVALEDFGEFGFCFVVFENVAGGVGEPGAAFGAGEAFFEGPAAVAGFEGEVDFGLAGMKGGAHFLAEISADFGAEKKGAVDGFGESTFTGFVRTADEITGGIELDC